MMVSQPDLDAALSKSPKSRARGLTALFVTLIIICVISISIVGYLAYVNGYLTGLPQLFSGHDSANEQEVTTTKDQEQAGVSLFDLGETKEAKPFRAVISTLISTSTQLSLIQAPVGTQDSPQGSLHGELDTLVGMSRELLNSYEDFERITGKHDKPKYQSVTDQLSEEFNTQFTELITILGSFYGSDPVAEHAAYLSADVIPATLKKYSRLDTAPFRLLWASSVVDRTEFLLDMELTEEYAQLGIRLETLELFHREFQRTAGSLPQYKVRSGSINKSARQLLDLLEAYAISLEELAVEFEEYASTLDPRRVSIRLQAELDRFRGLNQERHLYCFTEVYTIYVKDKKLEHEAYWALAGHLAFAEEQWPSAKYDYREVYNHYESLWDMNWRGD